MAKRDLEFLDLNHPAFTQDVDPLNMTPAMEALQQIKYESEDKHDDAIQYKEDGNYHFTRGNYSLAIENYTAALKKPFDDASLKAQLYTNRAISNFKLKNYRSAMNDSQFALQWNPQHLKAHVRGAHAALMLKKVFECERFLAAGLKPSKTERIVLKQQEHPNNSELLQIQSQCNQLKEQQLQQRATQESDDSAADERTRHIFSIKDRGIKILEAASPLNIPALSEGFTIAPDGRFLWPVIIFYPEFGQTDFLQQNSEDISIGTLLSTVFNPQEPPAPWDPLRTYQYGPDLKAYFEVPSTDDLDGDLDDACFTEISHKLTLKELLEDCKCPVTRDLIVPLHIISASSAYFGVWLKDRKIKTLC